jgi:hypothetical protein
MVTRLQHIGTFLHNEMRVSLRGMSPLWRHFVNSSSENLFLKVYTNGMEIYLRSLTQREFGLIGP